MSALSLDEAAAFASELADAARPVIRKYFRTGVVVDSKADDSPVTIADRTVEQTLRALIEARYPDHGIAGEEFGPKNLDSDYVWSLDPIDGTKAFITGRPTFGTLIGLLHRGKPVLGVIDCPVLDERWIGGPEVATALNGGPLMEPVVKPLDKAVLTATSPDMFDATEAERFKALQESVGLTLFSGDCHNFGLLALGTIDLVVEASLSDYDYLAPAAVVMGAGGTLTDWHGAPVTLGSTTRIVAARDPKLHAAAVAILSA